MRLASRALGPVVLVALLFLGTGCATGGGGGGNGPRSIRVTVENRIRPGTAVSVRMTSSAGIRRFLGSIPPGVTRELTYEAPSFSGTYRLLGETAAGEQIVSRPITLLPGAMIFWSLPSNSVSLGIDPRSVEADTAS